MVTNRWPNFRGFKLVAAMNSFMKYLPLAAALALGVAACSGGDGAYVGGGSDSGEYDEPVSDDLRYYELKGNVKSSKLTTFFGVKADDGSMAVDSSKMTSSTAYFDKLGGYVAKENERIRRDGQGRIVRWEDRRPNLKSAHPGFLKDTLTYEYVTPNQLVSRGRGAMSVIVFDDDCKIVGQFVHPEFADAEMSAFNVYKEFDRHGNWTERLTVWTTRGSGDKLPDVHYSLDRREIIYY